MDPLIYYYDSKHTTAIDINNGVSIFISNNVSNPFQIYEFFDEDNEKYLIIESKEHIWRLDSNGQIIWLYEKKDSKSIRSIYFLSPNIYYFGGKDIFAIDIESGPENWSIRLKEIRTEPIFNNDNIIIADESGLLKINNGEIIKKNEIKNYTKIGYMYLLKTSDKYIYRTYLKFIAINKIKLKPNHYYIW